MESRKVVGANIELNRETLKEIPKVELHRHLEGTFSLKHLYDLSLKNNLDTPRDPKKFKKFNQFPKKAKPNFSLFLSFFRSIWYSSLDDIEYIVYQSVKNLKKENLVYLELRFNPEHFSRIKKFDKIEVTKRVISAGLEAAKEIDLELKYIISLNRATMSAKEMIKFYKKMRALGNQDIVGIDISGDELEYPAELFTSFCDLVKEDGIYKIDIHAGEVSGPEQIWCAIDKLHANRIGHGVAAASDKKLREALKERKITLSSCLISNYLTNSWTDTRNHPINLFLKEKVGVTLNSDDPTVQNSELYDEYLLAVKYFGWSYKQCVEINRRAIEASFLPPKEKERVKKKYETKLRQFEAASLKS